MLTEFGGSLLLMLAYNLQGNDSLAVPLTYFALSCATWQLSGGHLNPSISIGVYMQQKRFGKWLLFMIFEMIVQTLGCLTALAIGFLVRVRVNDEATG